VRRDAIEELYDYTDFAWAAMGEAIRGLAAGSLTRSAPGSGWPALGDCLRHIVGAYDGWLHRELKLGSLVDPAPTSLTTWESFDGYRRSVRTTFRRGLDQTPDQSLYEEITRRYDEEDEPETLSLADILTNLLLHERRHHGDVTTLVHQLGGRPPFLDYRMYVFLKHNPDSPERPAGWRP
jgi:uncharacterized damage-inducible protein DinB